MQQVYHRALYSLGPDVGCYAPPKLYENELNESLQVKHPVIILVLIQQNLNLSLNPNLVMLDLGVPQKQVIVPAPTFSIFVTQNHNPQHTIKIFS